MRRDQCCEDDQWWKKRVGMKKSFPDKAEKLWIEGSKEASEAAE